MRRLVHVLGDPQHSYPVIHLTGHQRQGLDRPHDHHAAEARAVGRALHQPAPRAHQRADRVERRADRRRRVRRAASPTWPRSSRMLERAAVTYFEMLTAAAFRWFADVAVDVAVVEVGLRGRWDATNVCDAPGRGASPTSASTTSSPRADWRRRSPRRRPASSSRAAPSCSARPTPSSSPIFARGPPRETWGAARDFDVSRQRAGPRRPAARPAHARRDRTTTSSCRCTARTRPTTPRVALAAAEAFFGAPLDDDVVAEAFAAVRVPGRFEVVGRQPARRPRRRPQPRRGRGARPRRSTRSSASTGDASLVVGMLRRKRPARDARRARRRPARLVVACPPPSPRAMPAAERGRRRRGARRRRSRSSPDVADAVERGAGAGRPRRPRSLVTGSLYVVGAARAGLGR